jgi:carbonic anhydrase
MTHRCMTCTDAVSTFDRRKFLKTAALGSGVALYAALPLAARAAGAGIEALLLSCMDYRLIDETERYMTERGLRNQYDHIILAGASLGAVTSKFPAWNKTFWEHLDAAIKLHSIKKVMVMDHRECGAYNIVYGRDVSKNRDEETKLHVSELKKLDGQIHMKYPKLDSELLIMNLDGKVEKIA